MIRDCSEFEERIQQLMDDRIDPETDELICAHTAVCSDCYESMMAYSLLHSNYLNDSDSMKIKLEHLGLHDALARKKDEPNQKKMLAVATSIAAMILLLASLGYAVFTKPASESVPVAVAQIDTTPVVSQPLYQLDFETFRRIKNSIESNDLILYTSELPGIKPLRAFSIYISWVQESLFRQSENIDSLPRPGIE